MREIQREVPYLQRDSAGSTTVPLTFAAIMARAGRLLHTQRWKEIVPEGLRQISCEVGKRSEPLDIDKAYTVASGWWSVHVDATS